jgi:hypothetical protein
MIEFIFTIDYEIYGNGQGSLKELVYEPTQRLMSIFKERNSAFVVFAEALEFRKIQEYRTDDAIESVRAQLRQLLDQEFEIGLHLHPWWSNASRENGFWRLDWDERNMCVLPAQRIDEILRGAIEYLREAMGMPSFTPLSFRGGLWLMQPTRTIAALLSRHGIQVDSSVFKGGWTRNLKLDYRPSLRNGRFWRFGDDVNTPESDGLLLEVPIHTEMVAFWKMLSGKRLSLQRKVPTAMNGEPLANRWVDFARFKYPRKLDFCRMTYDELLSVTGRIVREDEASPEIYKPIVSIGHSKDLVDFDTIKRFLSYLERKGITVSTFRAALKRLQTKQA